MHLMHGVLLEPPIAISLYKDMSSCNTSSHFTHKLLTPSHTTIMNMPRYLILAWNERPFCRCRQRAKLITPLEPSTYERRCWVCLDTNPSGALSTPSRIPLLPHHGVVSDVSRTIVGLPLLFIQKWDKTRRLSVN
jgi:hypothetical protein